MPVGQGETEKMSALFVAAKVEPLKAHGDWKPAQKAGKKADLRPDVTGGCQSLGGKGRGLFFSPSPGKHEVKKKTVLEASVVKRAARLS